MQANEEFAQLLVISRMCGTPCPSVWPEVAAFSFQFVDQEENEIDYGDKQNSNNCHPSGDPSAGFPVTEAEETVHSSGLWTFNFKVITEQVLAIILML